MRIAHTTHPESPKTSPPSLQCRILSQSPTHAFASQTSVTVIIPRGMYYHVCDTAHGAGHNSPSVAHAHAHTRERCSRPRPHATRAPTHSQESLPRTCARIDRAAGHLGRSMPNTPPRATMAVGGRAPPSPDTASGVVHGRHPARRGLYSRARPGSADIRRGAQLGAPISSSAIHTSSAIHVVPQRYAHIHSLTRPRRRYAPASATPTPSHAH